MECIIEWEMRGNGLKPVISSPVGCGGTEGFNEELQ